MGFSRSLAQTGLSLIVLISLSGPTGASAQSKPAPNSNPDVLVLSNGDELHGKLVNAIQGKVTFHSEVLGDLALSWDKIKELHTSEKYAVVDKSLRLQGKNRVSKVPEGNLEVKDQHLILQSDEAQAAPPRPIGDVPYIMDAGALDKALHHQPGLASGWNGAATAGATLVTATQNQYAFSGGVGLVRTVPTVSWLNPRDRTAIDFAGSFGKITQPSYVVAGVVVPAITTKSALYHADAERDEYFSPRFYALALAAFDHNYAQDLSLQQIYGGGLGWTVLKTPKQEADLKATVQYEKQTFITGTPSSRNLIGSTFGAAYVLHQRIFTFTQGLAFIPAYNDEKAYSATETNTVAFPA